MHKSPHPINYHIKHLADMLGIQPGQSDFQVEQLPFATDDVTAGTENELQTAVIGEGNDIDLVISIRESNYYKNIIKRTLSGDTSKKVINRLDDLLNGNRANTWENSWVRFPRNRLSNYANRMFTHDMLKNKNNPFGPNRDDSNKFIFTKDGVEYLRVPASYLLKLSLADAISSSLIIDKDMKALAEQLLSCYVNDNTSPEIISFYTVSSKNGRNIGKQLAGETLKRYLLTQCLAMYANDKFKLSALGQKTIVYFAPNSPTRQNQLNNLISDSFYRELFMSPCLSGWENGEKKHKYMNLCHKVMSRSQLNCIAKLKECGILISNLAYLPNISNTSLANNGTHISIGSTKLTNALKYQTKSFTAADEKYTGDLVTKIVEHFLPLFVTTYSAAPFRMDFKDFHPEYALGFLPHQLDYTHLRMIWRRWMKKTRQKLLGNPILPTGIDILDRIISTLFMFKGDFIYDFRLINYFMSVLSTEQSKALNGELGNDIKLKKDLSSLGIFDERMSLYLLYKQREFSKMGFSGFEARYYSLFPDILDDMGEATDLQILITMLAYKLILKGEVAHSTIPDSPYIESERRQIFFESAIGLPTFYVDKRSTNLFLQKIIKKTKKTRLSNRYPGYYRVLCHDYKKALLTVIHEEGSDIVELLQAQQMLQKLEATLDNPASKSAAAKLTNAILTKAGAKNPFKLNANEFNNTADNYYSNELRKRHTEEAFDNLKSNLKEMLIEKTKNSYHNQKILKLFNNQSPLEFLGNIKQDVIDDKLSLHNIYLLIQIILINIDHESNKKQTGINDNDTEQYNEAPVYR